MKLKTLLLCVASTLIITCCGPAYNSGEPQKDGGILVLFNSLGNPGDLKENQIKITLQFIGE